MQTKPNTSTRSQITTEDLVSGPYVGLSTWIDNETNPARDAVDSGMEPEDLPVDDYLYYFGKLPALAALRGWIIRHPGFSHNPARVLGECLLHAHPAIREERVLILEGHGHSDPLELVDAVVDDIRHGMGWN